jgi:hypothetical protein
MPRLVRALALSLSCLASSATANECPRPTDPGGFSGYDYGSATVRSFGNAQVLVWYAIDGPHAVNLTTTRQDGVPDDVAKVAAVTSDALSRYAAMGYRSPVSDATNPSCGSNGGDGRFDVYLLHMLGADGMTVTESGRCATAQAGTACATFIGAQSNFAEYYATSDLGIRTVLPHETFHAVQDAYDVAIDRFWAEGTAQWAAKTLDPSLQDLERFLPAFFSASGRALDAPANGVTAAFLYGAAIWPVFLTSRHGDEVVREILEQEAQSGGSTLAATDLVLQSLHTSMAIDSPQFAAWNAATGTRAGIAGYTSAAQYPMVSISELEGSSASGVTSGFSSFYFHVKGDTPSQLTIRADAARNAGQLVPMVSGVARVDQAVALPADFSGEGIVVVSGITSLRTDAPFTVTRTAIADGGMGGCGIVRRDGASKGVRLAFLLLLAGLCFLHGRRRISGRFIDAD